ncbi:hypothetical protein OQ496_00915 [Acetobacter suratthaniensis]|uniref:Spore protein YkvP/CgeB glycosyl transferase-like domain-containing protein n=1 Tax=Acetobacter suratthaniensis TaxID=1502841 RepID=A0ABS3LIF2_9PROT|nr:hypothetical protein [Acetobacter suratthaniensis]MCX2565009.1 hypothetical protein [Acetobacter suratthaniensis]
MTAHKTIVSFVGENENGILRQLSHDLMKQLEPAGFSGHVIDLGNPDWIQQFSPLLQKGIYVALGHAGIGAGLEINGQSLWDAVKVPFVSIMADPPSAVPQNHSVKSRYVANAYIFEEWLRFQQRFIRSTQFSTLVGCPGVVSNPLCDQTAWRDRSQRMVFVKTGDDPERRRTKWQDLPPRWRRVLEDASASAVTRQTGDITDIFVAACDAHHVQTQSRQEIFYFLFQECDLYVRSYRANELVKALLALPVDIYGRGWDHLRDQATKARFHTAIDAARLDALYADTQFLLNTSPNVASGIHERVACGLAARCCVVSDRNEFSENNLKELPVFHGFDSFDVNLPAYMSDLYYSKIDYTDQTLAGLDYVREHLSAQKMMYAFLEIADELRFAEALVR